MLRAQDTLLLAMHREARNDPSGLQRSRITFRALVSADRFHGHVDTLAVGQSHHLLLPVGIGGADAVGRTELPGLGDAVRIEVD